MVMKKKAQAAMEFLMTYGWAILVVLVVIGALAYFGVLNPQNLLPEKCTLPMGLYCRDHLVKESDNSINLRLENGMGEGIVLRSVSVEGEIFTACSLDTAGLAALPDSGSPYNGISGMHIPNGDSNVVTITGGTIVPFTGKAKGDITIKYCSDTPGGVTDIEREANCLKFEHTMEGELLTQVES